METADPLLDLLHEELKQVITATITPAWKARVLDLAKGEDREYASAFRVALEEAFQDLAAFPEHYAEYRGKLPGKAPALEAAGYPAMTACTVCGALHRLADPSCPWCREHPAGLAAAALPWHRQEATRGAA